MSTLIGTSTSAPHTIIWNNVASGTYTLTAKATDNFGLSTTSAAVDVIVSNQPPEASISAPANNSVFSLSNSIRISASATDNGSISTVEFFQGATLIGTVTSEPYTFDWNNASAGTYTLTAKATDNLGTSTTSAPVTISVQPIVEPEAKLDLQTLLDANDTVVLRANSDYRTGGLPELVVASNKTIIGGYGTRVPQIIIPGGSSNIMIDGVVGCGWSCRDIKFTGTGGEPNNNITIIGGSYGPGYNTILGFESGAQVEGLRATYIGGINAQLSQAGFIRNSVFQAIAAYQPGINISIVGNTVTPSYGNAIVKFASTTPGGAANISTFGDLYMLQANVEAWDCYGLNYSHQKRAFIFSNMDALRMIGPYGGSIYDLTACNPGAMPGAMLEISSTPSVLQWLDASSQGGAEDTDDAYLDSVGTHILVQSTEYVSRIYTPSTPSLLLKGLWGKLGTFLNGATDPISSATTLTGAESSALLNSYLGVEKATAPIKPVARTIDTFPEWQENLTLQPDSAPMIQALIDRDHIVKLAAGKYVSVKSTTPYPAAA